MIIVNSKVVRCSHKTERTKSSSIWCGGCGVNKNKTVATRLRAEYRTGKQTNEIERTLILTLKWNLLNTMKYNWCDYLQLNCYIFMLSIFFQSIDHVFFSRFFPEFLGRQCSMLVECTTHSGHKSLEVRRTCGPGNASGHGWALCSGGVAQCLCQKCPETTGNIHHQFSW